MGYLHEGHLSLIRKARAETDVVVSSIFVNPLQFSPGEDLATYPRNLARDKELLRGAGCDILLAPGARSMYPAGYQTVVSVRELQNHLCGKHRPGHFDGVTTVVAKLLLMVRPDILYLGQKDYQQALIVKRMVSDLGLGVRVRVCPTVREPDGLAMSSRNAYLSGPERREAVLLYRSLLKAKEMIRSGVSSSAAVRRGMMNVLRKAKTAEIEYVEIVDPESLERVSKVSGRVLVALAVRIGNARLIDNMVIRS